MPIPSQPGALQFRLVNVLAVLTILSVSLLTALCSRANVIYVTTTDDKVSASGGCSLKEAISASIFQQNIAYPIDVEPHQYIGLGTVTTQCAPGSGNDIIVLPPNSLFLMFWPATGASYLGPTATPIVTSSITIEAFGSIIQYDPLAIQGNDEPLPPCDSFHNTDADDACNSLFRAFAVGPGGNLTIHNANIVGFNVLGGLGGDQTPDGGAAGGGGGGMGAGGAIYVYSGTLNVDSTTFQNNGAVGGAGGSGTTYPGGAGGGGIGGFGGSGFLCHIHGPGDGGGGGGSGTDGISFGCIQGQSNYGGGNLSGSGCAGAGGTDSNLNGQDGQCLGGGGGGGHQRLLVGSGNGGSGAYGGGGGGGAQGGGDGGSGGFGGGGGSAWNGLIGGSFGGNGGFGAGGGASDGPIYNPGHPGVGGKYGGNANSENGGGGAALGGAIFSDTGSVTVTNSTFFNNYVTRGAGGGAGSGSPADNGADAGGAIFNLNGALVVNDVTIDGNQSTGANGGIVVLQTDASYPTSFILHNTIIANNGAAECLVQGPNIAVNGIANLIENNDNCQGVETIADPQLGPLQLNGGYTPTQAIAQNTPAFNAADPGTSLKVDQRASPRPENGGYDIGAFELCVETMFHFCTGTVAPQTTQITILINPAGTGTTTPPAGTDNAVLNSLLYVTASPSSGYVFSNWTGAVANPANATTYLYVTGPQTITANFAPCSCAGDVTTSVTVTRGGFVLDPGTGRFAQTVTVTNISGATITGPISLVLDGLSTNAALFNASGITDSLDPPAGSPYLNSNASLAPGQSAMFALQFTDPSRAAITYTTRVLAGPGAR
jgi:CSLREA domain-containing protein